MRTTRTRNIGRQLVERALLRIDGRAIPITLRLNPRARRLIVKVHPSTGEVTVVAPSRRGLNHALDFARSERDWIVRRLAKVPPPVVLELGARIPFKGETHVIRKGGKGRAPVWIEHDGEDRIIHVSGDSEYAPRRVLDFLKREARKQLDARTTHFAGELGITPRRITVRDTASRWGSCSSGRSLSFSWRLILAPSFVLDYVVAHEVAHLREMNHGKRFWALLELLVADVEKPQRWLSQNGSTLHRVAPRLERLL
jgi:predicted metal-dependent hydrolase